MSLNLESKKEKQSSIKGLVATGLLSAWLTECTTMANKDFEEYNICIDDDKFHQTLEKLDTPLIAPVQLAYAAGGAACYMGQEFFIRLPILIGGITECGIRNLFSESNNPQPQTENTTNPNPTTAVESNLPEFCQRIK